MKQFFLLCFLCVTSLYCDIKLINDSPFPLTAQILSATGQELYRAQLQPQHSSTWSQNINGLDNYSVAQAPYTVIWTCQAGGEYGINPEVFPATFINAQSATGARICQVPDTGNSNNP